MASLSGNARSALRRQCRQVFEEDGRPSRGLPRRRGRFPPFLDALVELNHERWTAAGLAGTFVRKPLEHRFYRSFARGPWSRAGCAWPPSARAGACARSRSATSTRARFLQLQEGFDSEPPGIGNALRVAHDRAVHRGGRSHLRLPGRAHGAQAEMARRAARRPRPAHRAPGPPADAAALAGRLADGPLPAAERPSLRSARREARPRHALSPRSRRPRAAASRRSA